MTDSALPIKNPSVTLYAFYLCQDLNLEPGQLREDAAQLWQNCANLSESLVIPEMQFFPEKREKRRGRFIALVGTGLTVTGISSQSPGKPVESMIALDCPKAGFTPCLSYSSLFMLFHIGVGAIAALVVGLIIWLGAKNRQQ